MGGTRTCASKGAEVDGANVASTDAAEKGRGWGWCERRWGTGRGGRARLLVVDSVDAAEERGWSWTEKGWGTGRWGVVRADGIF
ncbi:hypothetical protein L3X38_032535 [Prunus dulcis]|uniref:Uncharacterized protein n=1 Tax=Prunus dulcis TaxID=3755 RepID=A0AAD4VEJ3_PRUDU|nr:hypothetical protein L3X38_032535 [Prunus dulcis]